MYVFYTNMNSEQPAKPFMNNSVFGVVKFQCCGFESRGDNFMGVLQEINFFL
jgi:hypothetical protein